MTMWLYIGLVGLAVAFALVPWHFVMRYGSRVVLFALLGPHMHYVGKMVDRAREDQKSEVRRYREADEAGKRAQLEAYRDHLMKEGMERVKKAQLVLAKRSKQERERLAYLETQKYNFINANTPTNANVKYVATADPSRSSAVPLERVKG